MRGGKCNREACSYKHDPSYAAATPAKDGNAEAKAEAKEKAKSKAKATSNPAAPVVAIIDSDDGQTSSGSEWEEADTDASTGDHAAVSEVKRNGKKVSFSKETNFTPSKPRRSVRDRGDKVRKVDVDRLYDCQHTEQVYDSHKARARAQLMRNMVMQRRKPKLETCQIHVPGSDILNTVVYSRTANVFYELAPNHACLRGLPEIRHVCDLIRTSEHYKQLIAVKGGRVASSDGCCFGHRVVSVLNVSYVQSRWKLLAWGVDPSALAKVCNRKHLHADFGATKMQGQDVKRTSKVARKLLESIVDAESPAKAVVTLGNTGAGPFDRVTIEFCCAHDSALEKSTGVRVHEHINANSKACEEMVLEELKRVRRDSPQAQVFVYAALPRTGGSSWQYVKEANGPNEKVPERKKVFRRLLKSLRRLLIRLADDKP